MPRRCSAPRQQNASLVLCKLPASAARKLSTGYSRRRSRAKILIIGIPSITAFRWRILLLTPSDWRFATASRQLMEHTASWLNEVCAPVRFAAIDRHRRLRVRTGRVFHPSFPSSGAQRGGSGVVFSSSGNSDPNKNGREYWAVVPGATKEELPELGSWSPSAQR